MINLNYGITGIKTALYDAFKKTGVSKNVCVGERPATTDKITDFVVIRIIAPVKNKIGIGTTICRIELYAKDINGKGNETRLSEMFFSSKKAMEYLSENFTRYTFDDSYQADKGSDGLGFHATSIDLFTTIKN
ncbi:MAG: hypothetical protein RR854_00155 [Muribaculaceae bacterium]